MAWRNPEFRGLKGSDSKNLRRIFQSLTLALDATDTSIGTKLTTPGAWTVWTPTLGATTTPPTLGSGSTATGRYVQLGTLVVAQFFIQFGTAGVANGTGTYTISLPVTAATPLDVGLPIGPVRLVDDSTGNIGIFQLRLASTTEARIQYQATWPTGAATNVAATAPWTWAASDILVGTMVYEAA